MSRMTFRFLCLLFMFALLAIPASAEKLNVNGNVSKINDRAKIAVDSNGNALIVWSNSNSKTNEKGVVYGREILKTEEGFLLGEIFQVSDKKGSNQHPHLVWLNQPGVFVITWDTSFRDLNEMYDFDHILDRPLPGAKVLARTYVPSSMGNAVSAPEDRLGAIEQVNDGTVELNVLPHATDIGNGQVLITFLGSDESESTKAGFTAGIWGATYNLSAAGVGPSKFNMARINRRLMLNGFNFNSQAGLGVITSSFLADGIVYAAGAYMKFNFDGDLFIPSGVGALYAINPGSLTVDGTVSFDEFKPEIGSAPLKANGQITRLGTSPAANDFTLVGTSNLVKQITTLSSDTNAPMKQKHGLISNKSGDIIDQFLFRVEDNQSVWILHHTSKGVFKYRAIGANGNPSGGSKKAFKTKKGRLLYMDVAVSGNDVLVAWTERKTQKRTLVFFDSFTIN